MKIYKVGGAVRDKILNRPVVDQDWVVVGATPKQMLDLGYLQVGKDFPVFLHPETKEEYALARAERKIAPGYRGFSFDTSPTISLEEDLKRRDITINAMAEDERGQIIDPYHGYADLQAGVLRHISPAFAEDPVRILRVARFCARFNFTVAEETTQLMRDMVDAGEVDALVPERVWAEMERALTEHYPRLFFEVLKRCGALKILFPEIEQLYGVPQSPEHHPEIDTGLHTMLSLDRATALSSNPQVRFATLLHDLGKGTTPKADLPRHIGHEERSADLVKAFCRRYRVPAAYQALAVLVGRYHLIFHRVKEIKPGTIVNTLNYIDAFRRPERLVLCLLACQADAQGRTGRENQPYEQAEIWQSAFQIAQQVDISSLLNTGLTGERLKMAIHHARVQAIAKLLKQPFHENML